MLCPFLYFGCHVTATDTDQCSANARFRIIYTPRSLLCLAGELRIEGEFDVPHDRGTVVDKLKQSAEIQVVRWRTDGIGNVAFLC